MADDVAGMNRAAMLAYLSGLFAPHVASRRNHEKPTAADKKTAAIIAEQAVDSLFYYTRAQAV